jgi:hypothetical protein
LCEGPVCAKTPAIPEIKVVRIEITNPATPKIAPHLRASIFGMGFRYHHAKRATRMMATIIKTMYCGEVNREAPEPAGARRRALRRCY